MTDFTTVIGEQTVVRGNLQGDEDLAVFGKLEGGVNLTKTLIVEGSGIVVADIEVRDAIISGVMVGNITASNSVQITEEGRMVGDISSPRVIIVDGASFKGAVDMGDLEAPPSDRPTPVRPPSRLTRTPARSEGSSVPPRRAATPEPAKAEPAPEPSRAKPEPVPRSAPARPAPKPKPKPKAPARPSKKSTKKKTGRKPPRPPKMPAGKRKVKRR